jgi:hypothetical protein
MAKKTSGHFDLMNQWLKDVAFDYFGIASDFVTLAMLRSELKVFNRNMENRLDEIQKEMNKNPYH